jgi:hypothetical protein
MAYFSERNNMRKPIERTFKITPDMYSLLIDCCEKYLENIAWTCPAFCDDGRGICGINYEKLGIKLRFDIPDLYMDRRDMVSAPGPSDVYDQYALLDYIEFIAQNCKDITSRQYHSYFHHYELTFSSTSSQRFRELQNEINAVFDKTGLLYKLTDQRIIERVVEHEITTKDISMLVMSVPEQGVRDLLNEAISLFRQPNPAARNTAVEKIWDAFERLKTFYCKSGLDKKTSVSKIIFDMANGQAPLIELFDKEFRELTAIGNDFRIRHHETTKIDISDIKHYDYFFNRCLSLIALAVQYLQ